MVNRNDYIGARSYLDQQIKTGEVNEKAQIELGRLLKEGYTREAGKVKGDAIYSDKGPSGTDFEAGFQWILKVEGTSYVADDAGAGPTSHGINSRAFPNEDIAGMTPARAKTLYRGIWNDIGADKLDPRIRMIAFDSAVNHGPGQTKKFLEQAQGDPQKLIDLRREFYADLIARDPGKFAQYEKGWENRLQKLESSITGERTLGTMLAETDAIKDPQEREIARQRIKNNYVEDQNIKQADYNTMLTTAQDAAYSRIGGWQDIPAQIWSSIKPEDRAKLVQGAPRGNDPDTVIMLDNNPAMWRKDTLMQYRNLLTEETYRKYFSLGNGPKAEDKIIEATIDADQFKRVLLDSGLKKLIDPKADTNDKRELIRLRSEVEREINLQQEAKKRKLTMNEKNDIMVSMLKPVKEAVTYDSWWRRSLNMTETEESRRAYQVTNREKIVIPPAIRTKILNDMERTGVMPTEKRILDAYLLMKETK
jgi:lysozyme family protein